MPKTIDCDSMITSMTLHPIEKEILVWTHDGMITIIGMDGLKKHQVIIEARTLAWSFLQFMAIPCTLGSSTVICSVWTLKPWPRVLGKSYPQR